MNLAGRWGPVALALGLGLLSVPLVAVSLLQPIPDWQQRIVNAPPMTWASALVLALVSVVIAALIGGSLGGRLILSKPMPAVLVALGTAWPIAIGMLPLTGSALGIPLRMGVYCIDTCTATLTNENAGSGFSAYPLSLVPAAIFIIPAVVAIALLLLAVWLSRRGRFDGAIVVAIGAYAALHVMSILSSVIAFACLAIGVIIWATVLRRTASNQLGPPDIEPAASVTVGEPH